MHADTGPALIHAHTHACMHVAAQMVSQSEQPDSKHAWEGIWIGFLLALPLTDEFLADSLAYLVPGYICGKNPVVPETDVYDFLGAIRKAAGRHTAVPAPLGRQAEADVAPDRKPEHGKVIRSLGQRADER